MSCASLARSQDAGASSGDSAPASVEVRPVETLAAFVPADAGFFLEIRQPTALNDGEQSRAFLAWLSQMSESEPQSSSSDDYRVVLSNWIGLSDGFLRHFEIESLAVVGEDRLRTHEAAVIFRGRESTDKGATSKLLKIVKTQRRGRAVVSQTESGVWLARRGDLFVVSASGRARGQFESLMRMLNQHDRPTLSSSAIFQAGAARFDDDAAIWIHLLPRPTLSRGARWVMAGMGLPGGPWFLAVDVKPDHFRIRALASVEPGVSGSADAAVGSDILSTIPQNTWLAWTTTWARDGLFSGIAETLSQWQADTAGDRLPIDSPVMAATLGSIVATLGERVTFMVGADTGAEQPVPTLGMLIESRDPGPVAIQLGALFQSLIRRPQAVGAVESPPAELEIEVTDRLGKQIWSLPIKDMLPAKAGETTLGALLRQSRLTWTALDEAVLVCTQPEMVERVLAARSGLAPRLGSMEELNGASAWSREGRLLGFAQPGLASHVLAGWIRQTRPPSPTSKTPETAPGESRPFRLGIRGDAKTEAGAIRVVEVSADGPAAGLLKVGDRILGVDGQLIPLEASSRDLRQILDRPSGVDSISLRVERDGRMTDVVVSSVPAGGQSAVSIDWNDLEVWLVNLRQIGILAFRVEGQSGDTIAWEANVKWLPRPKDEG